MSDRLKKYNEKQAIKEREKQAIKKSKLTDEINNSLEKEYTQEEIDFVKTKISFKGDVSKTLIDFWLDWREKNS